MTKSVDAMPHGAIEEVFPDVFFLTGTTRPKFMGADWQFSRNMTIVRDGGSLTLINTVRLDDAGLASLERLGKVEHVVRLGAFHGMDDAFYRDRYGATQWGLPSMKHEGEPAKVEDLVPGGKTPVPGASVFVFESSVQPEGLLHLDRVGGILVSCDSLQNWVEVDAFFDAASAEKMRELGFIRPANIGPGWRMACKPEARDFARLKALSFRHLLPAHGRPLRNEAHAQLSETFARELGL